MVGDSEETRRRDYQIRFRVIRRKYPDIIIPFDIDDAPMEEIEHVYRRVMNEITQKNNRKIRQNHVDRLNRAADVLSHLIDKDPDLVEFYNHCLSMDTENINEEFYELLRKLLPDRLVTKIIFDYQSYNDDHNSSDEARREVLNQIRSNWFHFDIENVYVVLTNFFILLTRDRNIRKDKYEIIGTKILKFQRVFHNINN